MSKTNEWWEMISPELFTGP
jgi:hypothetical protein